MSETNIRARAADIFGRAGPFLVKPLFLADGDDLAGVDAKLAYLVAQARARLAAAAGTASARDVLLISHLLSDAHTLRWDLRSHHLLERQRRFAVLDRGLNLLRQERDPDVLLDGISASILDCCGFDRVLVSKVDGDTWLPWRSKARHVRAEESTFASWLRDAPQIRLDPRLREGESVERREAILVFPDDEGSRVAQPFARARPGAAQGRPSGSYVAVPLAPSDSVVGLIHADYVDHDVTTLDREIIAAFARAFDRIYERAVLLWRLNDGQSRIAEAVRGVQGILTEMQSTSVALERRANRRELQRGTDPSLALAARSVATSGLASLLTRRELEVLAQMSTGATNDRIAGELAISRDTVKSHVKSILRKLGADNRGEAIAHYLRATMGSL